MTSLELFILHWSREHPIFLRVFRALPEAQLDYRPHPRSRSARELVTLLAYEERVNSELIDTGQVNWKEPAPAASLDEAIEAYVKAHQELERRLKRLDDKTWEEKKVKFMVDGVLLFEETYGGMLWGSLLDMIHHRGQLSVYIRPMGGKVPSIYGPSADDAGM